MAGQIKVSGAWHTAGAALVKVSGSWRSVTSGWVNIAGTWRQWFIGLVTDTFTRTTSGSLGTADTGQSWVARFGVWAANGAAAASSNGTSSLNAGALAVVDIGDANAVVYLGNSNASGVTPGTGIAFWSTASGSWWGAISYSDTSTSTYSCNCSNYCASCITCASVTTTSTYNAASTPGTTTYTYAGSATAVSATVSTRYCTSADVSNLSNPCTSTGTCNAQATGAVCSYTCGNGGVGSGGATCYVCSGGTVNGPTPSGSGSISSCYTVGTTGTTYSCNAGDGTPNANHICTHSTTTTPTYPSGCPSGPYASVAGTGTYPNCGCPSNSSGGGNATSCQTCTSTTTNYYLQTIYSAAGSQVYSILNTTSTTAEVKSIRVSVANSITSYTATAYDASYNYLTAISGTNSTGVAGTSYGIVKAYSPNAQGTTVDNFSAQGF